MSSTDKTFSVGQILPFEFFKSLGMYLHGYSKEKSSVIAFEQFPFCLQFRFDGIEETLHVYEDNKGSIWRIDLMDGKNLLSEVYSFTLTKEHDVLNINCDNRKFLFKGDK